MEFEVELGYELRSVPEAALMVRLSHSGRLREARRGGGLPTSSESNPGSEWIPIRADLDRDTVRFTVDLSGSSQLGRANRVLWAHIVSGNEPGQFDLLAFESFDEHQWFLARLSP
ncbi:MAG TPA: hypothetical protein VER55_07195 [Ardenticatenaceae bacterium]|nr:hypothetical protein [Ardenticatenaceae bacterium]